MRIWHISDTHGYHNLLTIPENIDMVIHSGDCSNYKNPYNNEPEVRAFIDWYSKLYIKHKIYVGGNHDTSIEKNLVTTKDFNDVGIIYLENSGIYLEGLHIWGSPYTPQYGNWGFMKSRAKIDLKVWQYIPTDTDILVTHGPPKGILDLSYSIDRKLEFCGCSALRKRILQQDIKINMFGHIHNNKEIINSGKVQLSDSDTIFSNASVVTDGKFGELSSNGNIFEV